MYTIPNIPQLPGNYVFAFLAEDGTVVGILWLVEDPILSALNARYVAVLPEYRDGNVTKIATDLMHVLARRLGLEKLLGSTRKLTGAWQNLGWQALESSVIYQPVQEDYYG